MRTWQTVAIIGVGLIGGSVGLALRSRKLASRVVGIGRRRETLEAAQRHGAITDIAASIEEGLAGADLVIVCTPVEQIAAQVCAAAVSAGEGTLITDAGSTKAGILDEVRFSPQKAKWKRGVRFVGSHPMAGNEKKGPEHAAGDLFEDRVVIITPESDTSPADVATVSEFWTSLGGRIVQMTPQAHDEAIASISHVPHVIASAIAASTPEEYVRLAAGGWLDTTRIAAADPHLWRQILLANRENVLESLVRFDEALGNLRSALAGHNHVQLEEILRQAKRVRDAVGN